MSSKYGEYGHNDFHVCINEASNPQITPWGTKANIIDCMIVRPT